MNVFKHPACNFTFNAPEGFEEVIESLPVMKRSEETVSFWKPEPEELAALNANGVIAVRLLTTGAIPPLKVEVLE